MILFSSKIKHKNEFENSNSKKKKTILLCTIIPITSFIVIIILSYFFLKRVILSPHIEEIKHPIVAQTKVISENLLIEDLTDKNKSKELSEQEKNLLVLAEELYKRQKNISNLDDFLDIQTIRLKYVEQLIKFSIEDQIKFKDKLTLLLDSSLNDNSNIYDNEKKEEYYNKSLETIVLFLLSQYNECFNFIKDHYDETKNRTIIIEEEWRKKTYLSINDIKNYNKYNKDIDISLLNTQISINIEMAHFIYRNYSSETYVKDLLECIKEFSEYLFKIKEKIETTDINLIKTNFTEKVENINLKTIKLGSLSPFTSVYESLDKFYLWENVRKFYCIELFDEEFFFTENIKVDLQRTVKYDDDDTVRKKFCTHILQSFFYNFFCYEKIRLIKKRIETKEIEEKIYFLFKKETTLIEENKSKIYSDFLPSEEIFKDF